MKKRRSAALNEQTAYHPTVWRTCRALANLNRLRCLRIVLEQPAVTVGEIAERLSLSVCYASQVLRALQARGLLAARRESRWVRDVAHPDPLVVGSSLLLTALNRALLKECRSDASLIRTLTAFTHVRRLEILRLLQVRSPLGAEDIQAHTRISSPALSRHLKKLSQRGMVSCADDRWSLLPPCDTLAATLLKLLATGT